MLQTQSKYLKFLGDIEELLQQSDITKELLQSRTKGNAKDVKGEIDELKYNVENAELIVPVIGGFSAGKSTLINRFLGKDILKVGIAPETAIATELRYSNEEYIDGVTQRNEVQRFQINEIHKLLERVEDFAFARLYLNNNALKSISPLILVDMPGFGASVQSHTQAIMQYIPKGSYFIALSSATEGTMQSNILSELQSVVENGKDFSVCLSKTDLKPPTQCQEIAKQISELLSERLGYNGEIAFKQTDNQLKDILSQIDSEALIANMFKSNLRFLAINIRSSINTLIQTWQSQEEEIEEELKKNQDNLRSVESHRNEAMQNIPANYANQCVENTLRAIANELENSIAELRLYDTQESLKEGILSKVRNIVQVETRRQMQECNKRIIQDFTIALNNINFNDEWIDGLTDAINSIAGIIGSHISKLGAMAAAGARALPAIAVTIGGIAIALNPIAIAIAGIAVAIAPQILNKFLKDKQVRDREKAIREAIPKICNDLAPQLQSFFLQQVGNTIENVSSTITKQLEQQQLDIQRTQEQKRQEKENIATILQHLEFCKTKIAELEQTL